MAKKPVKLFQPQKRKLNILRLLTIPFGFAPILIELFRGGRLILGASADIAQIASSTGGMLTIGMVIALIVLNILLYLYENRLAKQIAEAQIQTGSLPSVEYKGQKAVYQLLNFGMFALIVILAGVVFIFASYVNGRLAIDQVMMQYMEETKKKEDTQGYGLSMPFMPSTGSSIRLWDTVDDKSVGRIQLYKHDRTPANSSTSQVTVENDIDNSTNKVLKFNIHDPHPLLMIFYANSQFRVKGGNATVQYRIKTYSPPSDAKSAISSKIYNGKWHTITLRVKGNQIERWLDGHLEKVEISQEPEWVGGFAFQTDDMGVYYIDDVLIWTQP